MMVSRYGETASKAPARSPDEGPAGRRDGCRLRDPETSVWRMYGRVEVSKRPWVAVCSEGREGFRG